MCAREIGPILYTSLLDEKGGSMYAGKIGPNNIELLGEERKLSACLQRSRSNLTYITG